MSYTYRLPCRTERAIRETGAVPVCGVEWDTAPSFMRSMQAAAVRELSASFPGTLGQPSRHGTVNRPDVPSVDRDDMMCADCGVDYCDAIVKDGMYVCTCCGIVRGNIYAEPPFWYGTHTIHKKATYDFRKHVDTHLAKLAGQVHEEILVKIRAVFPSIYEAFFKVAKNRKNFMSYGFVISKLLGVMNVPTKGLNLTVVKTPSKIKECEAHWRALLCLVDIGGL